MPPLDYDGTLTLSFPCTDRAASAAWYEEQLGFEKLFDADDAGWTELKTSVEGVTLGLGEGTEAQVGNCVPVFGVKDVAVARARLEGAGVRFDGETLVIDGMVKLATFYDPDENALMLAESLAG